MDHEDIFSKDGSAVDIYEKRWPGCKKGDGHTFYPNALTALMTDLKLSMGARELLRLYAEIDIKWSGKMKCSDRQAAILLGVKRRTIINYKKILKDEKLIDVQAVWNPKTRQRDIGIIDINPMKVRVAKFAKEQREDKAEAKTVSHTQNTTEPSEQLDETMSNNMSSVVQESAQLEGVVKGYKKNHKGITESGHHGSVDWLADQADAFVRLEIRRRSRFDRDFSDYSEEERQDAWKIALQRRELEKTTENE